MRFAIPAIAAFLLAGSSAHADCAADFAAIMKHGKEAGPFRIEGMDNVGKLSMTTVAEMVPPSAAHIRATTPQGEQEVIIIGDQAWGNVKGIWLALDEKTARQMRDDLVAAGILYSDGARNIQCLGEKSVDGATYLTFSYEATIGDFTVPMTLLVDPASRLPVRTEGSLVSGADTAHFNAAYSLDPTVKIEPPPKP